MQQAYLPLCVKVHIYSIRSFVSLFNGREIFCVVMMTLGGGRAIITLRTADRDRGRPRGCQRSWEVTCRHFIPVLSLYKWRNVGHSRLLWWRARLAYFNQWFGQTYPDRICRSSGCDMTIVRMWYLQVSCASPWGNPDRRSAPRVLLGKSGWEYVPRVIRKCVPRGIRGRGPYNLHLA